MEGTCSEPENAAGEKTVVKLPVPRSDSSGMWIPNVYIPGLVPGNWYFIEFTPESSFIVVAEVAHSR